MYPHRSSHVSYSATVRSIAIDFKKRAKVSGSWPNAQTVWTTAFNTRSSECPRFQSAKKRSPKSFKAAQRSSVDASPRSSTMSSAWRQKP